MCATIIRSPVIIRRPIRSLSFSVGIDSQRCKVAFRSIGALLRPWTADDRSRRQRGQSGAGVAVGIRRGVGVGRGMPMRTCALAGIAVSFLASPPLAGPAPGATDAEIVPGLSARLSGPAAAWGSISLAAETWARHVNAAGGVHGRKLRVVIKDDAYNPGQAVANVNEM